MNKLMPDGKTKRSRRDIQEISLKGENLKKDNSKRENRNKENIKGNNVKVRWSIAKKLVIAFLIPVFFTILVGAISYNKASNAIVNNYKESSLQSIEMTSEYINFGLESVKATSLQYILSGNAKSYFNGLFKDPIENNNAMNNIKKDILAKSVSDDFVENIHFISKYSNTMTTATKSQNEIYEDFLNSLDGSLLKENPKAKYWIGKSNFLDDIFNLDSKDYAMRYVSGFMDVRACVIIDISYSKVNDILQGLNFGDGNIVGLITEDGKEIISTETDETISNNVFTNQSFYKNSILNEEDSLQLDVQYQGANYLFISSKIGDSGARVCALIPESTITSKVADIKMITMVLVVLSCFIAIVIGTIMATGMQKTIRYIIGELNLVAEGNLKIKIKVKRKDEFAILANGLNHMVDNVSGLIEKVKSQSSSVTISSGKVLEASEVFSKATQGINESISEIQAGVYQQAEDSQNCLSRMDNLSEKIEIVNGKTSEIKQITTNTKYSISNGMESMEALNIKAQSTAKITDRIVLQIEALEKKSQSIGQIIAVINNIAEETNLLSLNASIEASRAGEFGKGFQVVATEIRKLADQSVHAVQDIENLIKEMQIQTKETVIIANEAEGVIGEQEVAVTQTEESFHDINLHVEGLIKNVDDIVNSIYEIEKSRTDTLMAIENISAVSEETAAASSTVSESAQNQMKAVESLQQLAHEFQDNAKALGDAVLKFEI